MFTARTAADAAAPNANCTIIVPANPLSAQGLATPYQLTATDPAAGPCNEANCAQTAFVQGAIVNPATGTISTGTRAFPARKLNGNDTRARLGATVAEVIDRKTVRRLIEHGAQIVDVLPAEEYGADHLPGAINLPLRKIEAEACRDLDRARPIIVYCADSA